MKNLAKKLFINSINTSNVMEQLNYKEFYQMQVLNAVLKEFKGIW